MKSLFRAMKAFLFIRQAVNPLGEGFSMHLIIPPLQVE